MGYDARKREEELLARIGPLYREALAAGSAPPAQLEMEQALLRAACRDYLNYRNKLLDDIWRTFDPARGVPIEQAVKTIVACLVPVPKTHFTGRLRNNARPSPQADLFCIRAENEEAMFLAGLSKVVEMASKRDRAVAYRATVAKQVEDLDVRWKDLERQHGYHDDSQKRVAAELQRLLDEAAITAAARAATRNEKIMRTLGIVINTPGVDKLVPGDLGDLLKVFHEGVKVAVKMWQSMWDLTSARKRMLQDGYRSESGTTLVLYRDFQAETRRFMEVFGYELLLKECGRGEAAVEEFVAACPTEAQKTDMRVFVDELKRVLRLRRDEAKGGWDDFVKRHSSKFFGPMSPENLELFLSDKSWQEREKVLVNKHEHLLGLLRAWRDDTKEHYFISLSTRSEELKLLLAPIVAEFGNLIGVWELNMKLAGELASLCDDRENDVKSLS